MRDVIAELKVDIREQGAVLWGDDRTRSNGLRSKVKAHTEEIAALSKSHQVIKDRIQHYIDVEREDTCPTMKLLLECQERHEAELAKQAEGDTDVTVAQINASAIIEVAKKTATEARNREWIIIIGLILSIVSGYIPKPAFGATRAQTVQVVKP
jgi:ribosomal protein L11 methylase PrmA